MTVFALSNPIGIVAGIILSQTCGLLVQGIFMALCTGTFMYVAMSEIITEELSDGKDRWWKFLSIVAGVGLMGALFYFQS